MRKFFLFLYILFLPDSLFADQPIDMLRVLCMPDSGIAHFSFHLESYTELADYIFLGRGSDDQSKKNERGEKERIRNLRKYGLIYTKNFDYECILPKSKYQISGNNDGSRIKVTLEKSGQPILKDVYISPEERITSGSHPYISNVVIEEYVDGWGGGVTYITVADADKKILVLLEDKQDRVSTNAYYECLTLHGITAKILASLKPIPKIPECDALRKVSKPLPITQNTLKCLVNNGSLERDGLDAKKNCILYSAPTAPN